MSFRREFEPVLVPNRGTFSSGRACTVGVASQGATNLRPTIARSLLMTTKAILTIKGSTDLSDCGNGSDAILEQSCIDTVRTLSMDAVQQAKSGHPGTPMALAPVIYTLWQRFLRFDPEDPIWPNRDRFVLSNGHASMLI
jgi:hypothetical protein